MSGSRDKDPVWITRIDRELRDLLSVTQSEMRPGLARVGGFVDAVTHGEVRPMQTFAAPDVDHVRIRIRNCQGPH